MTLGQAASSYGQIYFNRSSSGYGNYIVSFYNSGIQVHDADSGVLLKSIAW